MGVLHTLKHSILMFLNKEESFRTLKEEVSLKDSFFSHLILFVPFALFYGLTFLLTFSINGLDAAQMVSGISFGLIGIILVYGMFGLIAGLFHLLFKLFGAKGNYGETLKGVFVFNIGFIIYYLSFIILLSILMMFLFTIPIMIAIVMIPLVLFIFIWAIFISSKMFAKIHEFETWKAVLSQVLGFTVIIIVEIIIVGILMTMYAGNILGFYL
ncbi:MAG: YIP1 family protein [Nanoarchaeota archaeon]|nr:YIP1 family protein [Nanoarchaeota archaeon]